MAYKQVPRCITCKRFVLEKGSHQWGNCKRHLRKRLGGGVYFCHAHTPIEGSVHPKVEYASLGYFVHITTVDPKRLDRRKYFDDYEEACAEAEEAASMPSVKCAHVMYCNGGAQVTGFVAYINKDNVSKDEEIEEFINA